MAATEPGVPPAQAGALAPPAAAPGGIVFDPAPHINAIEHDLKDWLNKPTRDILRDLGLDPHEPEHHDPEAAAASGGAGNPGMIAGMMAPLTSMLGMLGNGIFQGMNPQQMFQPMMQAFQQSAQSLQGLMGQMGQGGWGGAGAAGTGIKTVDTLTNGAAVAAQGSGLATQGTAAGATAQQGYARMIELINELHDRLAALSGGIPFTTPVMGETAAEHTGRGTELISELLSELTAQAGSTLGIGAPQAVTGAPQAATSMIGPMLQMATSMAGPALQTAMMPMMMGMQGMQTGLQAGTGLISQLAQAGAKGAAPAAAGMGSGAGAAAHLASAAPKGGGGAGGGGGGPVATPASRALAASPMLQAETAAANQGSAVRAAGMGGAGMGGAGMMGGAPMGGAGKAGASGTGNHSSASFLHTSDQGGEIVGDLGSVAPPVIGESDPNAAPDVELRI